MRIYYKVCTGYKLACGKPQLVSVTLHSSTAYYPFLVCSTIPALLNTRYFRSAQEAHRYINYLFMRYPQSGLPYPALDAGQHVLF
jgi:hypothetical protein